jgi:glyoxylase-like metal-dependent hydrolase (beta-lactamase superfamily II)
MAWAVDIIEVGVIPNLPLNIYLPEAPPSALIDVPCYCYLLTGPASCVLVDSGPDPERAAEAGLAVVGEPAAAIRHALQRRGANCGRVNGIIHTHLHYDHMQNDGLFPSAWVFVQRRELEWARSAEAGPYYVGVESMVDEAGDRLRLLDGECARCPA